MPDVVWGGLQVDAGGVMSLQTGSQQGPPGGDGWTIMGRLSTSKLLNNRRYVFLVSGTVRRLQVAGGTPVGGLVQVALGDPSGMINPYHCFEMHLNWPTAPIKGIPFQFLVMFDAPNSGITDPAWGATWPNADDLCVYARTYTNGDPQNYACAFEVIGLTWLWIDLEQLDPTRFLCAQHYPSTPIVQGSGGWTDHYLAPALPGSEGENWVHFLNLWTEPVGAFPPHFRHGWTATGLFSGLNVRVGSSAWGIKDRGGRWLASRRNSQMHLGAFVTMVRPAGSVRWGYQGFGQCIVHRWRYFALRIDELPEVSSLSLTSVGPLPVGPTTNDPIVIPHEPPPLTGYVATPIYLASMRARPPATLQFVHGLDLRTNRGRDLWLGPPLISEPSEGVPQFGAAEVGLGRGEGVRYEASLRQVSPVFVGHPFTAEDIELLQVWLIQDPSVLPPDPDPPGEPIVLVPSREGVAVDAQPELPVQPDGAVTEAPHSPEADVIGVAGVRRSWPLLTGPRREWSLSWSALRDSERLELDAFLRANVTFRWQPPQETVAVAVIALDAARFEMLDSDAWVWRCTIRIAELVFVGGG